MNPALELLERLKQARPLYNGDETEEEIVKQLDYKALAANHVPKLCEMLEVAIEALESVHEYWNRDQNEQAMADACNHATEKTSEALDKLNRIAGETE